MNNLRPASLPMRPLTTGAGRGGPIGHARRSGRFQISGKCGRETDGPAAYRREAVPVGVRGPASLRRRGNADTQTWAGELTPGCFSRDSDPGIAVERPKQATKPEIGPGWQVLETAPSCAALARVAPGPQRSRPPRAMPSPRFRLSAEPMVAAGARNDPRAGRAGFGPEAGGPSGISSQPEPALRDWGRPFPGDRNGTKADCG